MENKSKMTVDEAVNFALNIIKETKVKMLLAGTCEPEQIYAACNKLADKLKMPVDLIFEAFSVVEPCSLKNS